MRRLAAFIVAMLPLDRDGRRAMDETLADWQYEAGLARSALARGQVATAGLWAIASVVARSAVADLRRPHTYRITVGTVGLSVLLAMAIVVGQTRFLLWWPESVSTADAVVLVLLLLPTAAAISLPLAVLTPPFAQERLAASSLFGLVLILSLMSVVNLGWIQPTSNQVFRELTASMLNRSTGGDFVVSPKGLAELTVPELIARRSSQGEFDTRVLRTLSTRAAHVLMVSGCLLLGVQARRVRRARGWRSGGALVAWGVTVGIWTGAVAGSNAAYRVLFHRPTALSEGFFIVWPWVMPAAFVLSAILLAWLASRNEYRDAEPAMGVH